MSTMDLLTIPGLDNSAKLQEMYAASKSACEKGWSARWSAWR